MWNVWLNRSIIWVLALFSILVISTSVSANAPQPSSLYWLQFDSQTTLQSVQIGQCDSKNCLRLELLKQFGRCDRTGCLNSPPKLTAKKPLGLECADHLCLVSISPFYDPKELNLAQLRLIAQLDDRVFASEIFP